MAGKHSNATDERNEAAYISNLRYAATRLNAEGIVGLIEPINKYSVPGYYLNSFDQAIRVLKAVNSSSIKLQLDLFHLQLIRGDITHTISDVADYVGHVQIAQAPDRHEPDSEGEVNLKFALDKVEASYGGWLGCEYTPANGTVAGLKWIKNFGYEL